jgi:hypothetical protein
MEKKYTAESLKETIMMLEIKQTEEGRQLRDQLITTYNNINPFSFIKNAIGDISISSELKNSIIDSVVGIATGFISKKILIGSSSSKVIKLAGVLLQYGLTSIVTKNFESIKNSFLLFMNNYLRKKEEHELKVDKNIPI